jgi:hypothetical protein
MILRAFAVWVLLVALAVVNGTFRAAVLIPRLGERTGHVISTVMLSDLIFLVTLLTIGWIGPATLADAALVGTGWLGLTVAFEFGAGHYLFDQPWERLLADYNISKGRIWILVLIATAASPALAAMARGLFRP